MKLDELITLLDALRIIQFPNGYSLGNSEVCVMGNTLDSIALNFNTQGSDEYMFINLEDTSK